MNCNSKRKEICILLDPAHGKSVAGKKSPDSRLREYLWSRRCISKIIKRLQDDGYRAVIITESIEEIGLANRVQICANYSKIFGKMKTVFLSVHCNAARSDGKWSSAHGWCVFVSNNCSDNSKKLAEYLYDEVESRGIHCRKPLPKQKYWQQNFYVIKNTPCPAALVETLFMDNKDDCEYLLSEEGMNTFVDCYVKALEKYVDELVGITKNETVTD